MQPGHLVRDTPGSPTEVTLSLIDIMIIRH